MSSSGFCLVQITKQCLWSCTPFHFSIGCMFPDAYSFVVTVFFFSCNLKHFARVVLLFPTVLPRQFSLSILQFHNYFQRHRMLLLLSLSYHIVFTTNKHPLPFTKQHKVLVFLSSQPMLKLLLIMGAKT